MIVTLKREAYLSECTIGMLEVGGRKFATLENPRDATDKHDRCLPPGEYRLVALTRASGEKAFGIVNPSADVWLLPSDVPKPRVTDARSAVFIACGFSVNDTLGGHIAPGKGRCKQNGTWQLELPRDAMNEIRTLIGNRFDLKLLIEDSSNDTQS